MSELASIITAAVGAVVPLGGGVAFVWNKVEKRMARFEAAVAECERREDAAKERGAVQLTAIELMWQELSRLSPDGNPVLHRVGKLLRDLREALPVDPKIPEAWAVLLDQLDKKGG